MSNPLSDAWGDFLGQFPWDWFVTLTFAGNVKTFTAHNRCNAWLRSLEWAAGHPIFWFRGDECGNRFGKFHMHLLIGNVAHLHRFAWMKRWEIRNGWARIFEFDPALGASYYVAKYVTKQFGEWELSDNLDAFRVQQPALPLVGQVGSPISEKKEGQRVVKEYEDQIDPGQPKQSGDLTRQTHIANLGTNQLSLSDYTEPDLSEVVFLTIPRLRLPKSGSPTGRFRRITQSGRQRIYSSGSSVLSPQDIQKTTSASRRDM